MIAEVYECLATMWQDHHIPAAWKWKWFVPIPKNSSRRIQDIRPIMLMEVLQKLWTGLLVDEVTSSLQRHSALSAWEKRKPLYGCSWDMSKAFDSVSKPLIVLCWQRKGLPVESA